MNYYFSAFKNYAKFSGRARRSEFWYFSLFNTIITYGLLYLSYAMGNQVLYTIYVLATFIPSLAVGVRRMHDVDKSGWFLIIPLYNLILAFTDGTPGPNEYGDDPKNRQGFGAVDYEKPIDINLQA
jgi:uncharacterized membrane protein YhaH (DUF805 family)